MFRTMLVFAVLLPSACLAAEAKPTIVSAKPTVVTVSGPVTFQIPPAIDPAVIGGIQKRLGGVERRLGKLEKGQAETNKKLDLLLGKVDAFLDAKKVEKTKQVSLEEERKMALEKGAYITCSDGKVRQFWREPGSNKLLVSMKYGDGFEWFPVENMTTQSGYVYHTGWHALRGANWEYFLPEGMLPPIAAELDRLFPPTQT